ncbi:MAG: hypothetical protein QM757_04370 [Paludibaculum sp.]
MRRAGVADLRFEGVAGDTLHAAGVAAEEDADFVGRVVGLVDAYFLAAAAGEVDEIGG